MVSGTRTYPGSRLLGMAPYTSRRLRTQHILLLSAQQLRRSNVFSRRLRTCTCRTGLRNRTVRRAMGKRVAPDIKYVRVANAYKMVSYTLILLKKFAARPRRESFFIAKRGGEKISVAKMKFRSSARPDLRITLVDRNRDATFVQHGTPAVRAPRCLKAKL